MKRRKSVDSPSLTLLDPEFSYQESESIHDPESWFQSIIWIHRHVDVFFGEAELHPLCVRRRYSRVVGRDRGNLLRSALGEIHRKSWIACCH